MVKNGNGYKRKSHFRTPNGKKQASWKGVPSSLRTAIDWSNIDEGIKYELRILRDNGIETTESCQGGQGHPFPVPTIRFCGIYSDGLKAVSIAMMYGLKVKDLRRVWHLDGGELVGPEWEMTFYELHSHLGGGLRFVPKRDGSGTVKCKWV
jgi:hypothetical protein